LRECFHVGNNLNYKDNEHNIINKTIIDFKSHIIRRKNYIVRRKTALKLLLSKILINNFAYIKLKVAEGLQPGENKK